MSQQKFVEIDVFVAWNDTGEYAVSHTAEEALSLLSSGDGQLTRAAKLGPISLPLPQIENGNGLLPPSGPHLKIVA